MENKELPHVNTYKSKHKMFLWFATNIQELIINSFHTKKQITALQLTVCFIILMILNVLERP